MQQILWSATIVLTLFAMCDQAESRTIVKRATHSHEIDPQHLKDMTDHSILRDKRKVEVVTGVKNAILGFVFNKINSFIDHKTHWVAQLDKTNVAKNEAAHIYPPKDPITTISDVISGAIGEKLQQVGPILNIVTSKLGHLSNPHGGLDIGALISKGLGGSSSHASTGHAATANGAAI